jgi:hypothetical protein
MSFTGYRILKTGHRDSVGLGNEMYRAGMCIVAGSSSAMPMILIGDFRIYEPAWTGAYINAVCLGYSLGTILLV